MSTALKTSLDGVIDRALADHRIVGTVVLVAYEGQLVYRQAAGLADREAGIPMREDAIFRLASLTKPIASATAMALVERGQLQLDDAVTKWLPEFQPAMPDGSRPPITIAQLLSHTAGLAYGFWEAEDGPYHRANISDGLDQPGLSLEENLRRIASVPLSYLPGSSWAYSISTDVVGGVIERACGCSLPEAVTRFITGPLAMADTSFQVHDPSRLAVPYSDGVPEPIRMGALHLVKAAYGPGFIRFAPERFFDASSYPSAGCGMVGTAEDFLRFLEALRTGGGPVLSPESVQAMTSDQSGGLGPQPGKAFGFGLSVVADPAAAQIPQSTGSFAWGGVYGHSWSVDPTKRLTVLSLTNTAVEGTSGQFPAQIREAVYAAL